MLGAHTVLAAAAEVGAGATSADGTVVRTRGRVPPRAAIWPNNRVEAGATAPTTA